MVNIWNILLMGFVLGIKHAVEPDHFIAVSTIVTDTKKISKASLVGVWWGIGHTLTLFIIGMIFILLKKEIPTEVVLSLEFVVGIMLVYLGVKYAIFPHKGGNHRHTHGRHQHKSRNSKNIASYIRALFIGSVHGLSGSAALVLLTMTTVTTVLDASIYIVCFGLGTVIGMFLCTLIIGIPFITTANNEKVNLVLTRITGVISMLFGCYYMYQIAFVEGLFM